MKDEKEEYDDTTEDWPARRPQNKVFFDDLMEKKDVFRRNKDRMFVASDKVDIEVCVVRRYGCKAEKLHNAGEIESYLNCIDDKATSVGLDIPIARMFFIEQPYSRARFAISEKCIKLLLSRLGVFSKITNILTCFGVEDGPRAEGRSGFFEETNKNISGGLDLETAYVLKHVEHKPGSNIPWSIRQMGVYQSFDTISRASSSILMQTSEQVKKHIFELTQSGDIGQLPDNWTSIHEIHLSSLASNWSDFIKCIDMKISEIEDEVRYARRGTEDPVTFETLQKIGKYNDMLIRISHALQLNIQVLEALTEATIRRQNLDGKDASQNYEDFRHSIRTCITEHGFLKHHVSLVQTCSQELSTLVQNTITLKDSDVMLTLTQRTIQEAQTMKTITFVALIYLPASFTATFLSMGFVHVESLKGVMRLDVSQDMWFYLAITAPLMVVTLIGWWFWEGVIRKRSNAKYMKQDEEAQKDV